MKYSEVIQQEIAKLTLTPWEAGAFREQRLAQGLRQLAALHGIRFREPLQIDTNGEFSLVVPLHNDNRGGPVQCSSYGESFVALLNKHNPRTGIRPTKYMDPRNGWCRINHFDVERMLDEGLPVLEGYPPGELPVAYSHATTGRTYHKDSNLTDKEHPDVTQADSPREG